jgi:hypothetical protein
MGIRPFADPGGTVFESPFTLFLMSAVVMVDLYWAQRSATKRPEVFYAAAAVMFFACLLAVRG